VQASLIDGVVVAVIIILIDKFLSHRSFKMAILYGVVFGAIAFLLRVLTRPERPPGVSR
jgi:xanthine/uracil permease